MTGSAAALRRELEQGIELSDPSGLACSVNEVRELCTHLLEVMHNGDAMPSQPADAADAAPRDRVNGAWRAEDDVFSSARDVSLFGAFGEYLAQEFKHESQPTPSIEQIFSVYPARPLLDLERAPALNDDCAMEAVGAQHMHALRHLLIIGRPLQAFDGVFRYLLALAPAAAAAAAAAGEAVDVPAPAADEPSAAVVHRATFHNRVVAAMYRNFVDLAHKAALANLAEIDITNSCLVFLDLMERLAASQPGSGSGASAAAGAGVGVGAAGANPSASRQMARLAFLIEVGRALLSAPQATGLSSDAVTDLLYRAHCENRDLALRAAAAALDEVDVPSFAFFAKAPKSQSVVERLQLVATHRARQQSHAEQMGAHDAAGVAAAAADTQTAVHLLAAAALVFNLPLPSACAALGAAAADPLALIRFVFAAAEVLDVPTHFLLAHLNRASSSGASSAAKDPLRANAAHAPLLERLALTLGASLGVVVGPNAPVQHAWHAQAGAGGAQVQCRWGSGQ